MDRRYGSGMTLMPEESLYPLRPKIAYFSIACFWSFYFAIVTLRSLVVSHHDQLAMLGRRTLVSLISVGITCLFYLLLRRVPIRMLKRSILTAALLAAPAAILYSTVNCYLLDQWHSMMQARQPSRRIAVITSPAPPSSPDDGADNDQEEDEAPPPSAPPESVMVGKVDSDDEMTMFQEIADQAANGYFFFAAWAALYLALCYAGEVAMLERRAASLRAAAQAAELRALRYQVNPHFLFNTLNSLSSLVLGGRRDEAERMIINLSKFFRTSLTDDPTEDVPLSEEILLQRLYLEIELVRFPERLIVDIDIPEDVMTACVPGMILQSLVENAVKYGVSRAKRPITVELRAREERERLVLTVRDDGDPMKADDRQSDGTGVGLRNVRDRLAARFGETAQCRWGPIPGRGFAVELTMPMVRRVC